MFDCYRDKECNCDNIGEIYKGEDTNAFGQNFLTINAKIPEGWVISKLELIIENLLPIVIYNPVFPLDINLNKIQTQQLHKINKVKLVIYDSLGRRRICDGQIIIKTKD